MAAHENKALSIETAEALLTAIKAAAPGADGRGSDGLKNLADAYASVVGAMPKRDGSGRVVGM